MSMPKGPSKKMYEWRVTRIRATPAALIGYVEAPDAEEAIKEAIRAFGITDPEQRKRLAAQRVKEIKTIEGASAASMMTVLVLVDVRPALSVTT